jgi:hypothetical protein
VRGKAMKKTKKATTINKSNLPSLSAKTRALLEKIAQGEICPKSIKMSHCDVCMATERSSEFIKDRKKFYKFFEKEKAGPVSEENTARYEEIKSKWNIEEPHYMIIDNMAIDGKSPQFKKSKFAILNHELPSLFYLEYTNSAQGRVLHTNGTLPKLKVRKLNPIEESSQQLYPFFALPEKGNWYQVHWNIDLSKSDDDLRNIFSEKIRNLKKMVEDDKTRQHREMLCDPWKVYDLHKLGHALLEIARQLYGIEYSRGQTTAYNERLGAAYQSVRRALDSARKMIKSVEEEAHYRINIQNDRFEKNLSFNLSFLKELSKMYE